MQLSALAETVDNEYANLQFFLQFPQTRPRFSQSLNALAESRRYGAEVEIGDA